MIEGFLFGFGITLGAFAAVFAVAAVLALFGQIFR